MRTESQTEYQTEYHRFYSANPYEVLGIDPNSSKKDIETARKRLIRKFHPDINPDPMALEISKMINAAADTLLDEIRTGSRKGSRRRPSSPPPPPPRPQQQPRQEQTWQEPRERTGEPTEEEKEFLKSIRLSPQFYAKYLDGAKKKGLTNDKIAEYIQSPEAVKTFVDHLVKRARLYFNSPNMYKEYINEWQQAGLNIGSFIKHPDVKKAVAEMAVDKIKAKPKIGPEFANLVGEWKRAGVDISTTSELNKFLEDTAQELIKSKINDPALFIEFVEEWKQLNIDLTEQLNVPAISKYVKDKARERLATYGREQFVRFVQSWMTAGWSPDAEILNML